MGFTLWCYKVRKQPAPRVFPLRLQLATPEVAATVSCSCLHSMAIINCPTQSHPTDTFTLYISADKRQCSWMQAAAVSTLSPRSDNAGLCFVATVEGESRSLGEEPGVSLHLWEENNDESCRGRWCSASGRVWFRSKLDETNCFWGENKISPPWSLQTDKEVEGKISKKQKIFIFDRKWD